MPIILVGSDYWQHFRAFLEKEVLSRGMIDNEDLTVFKIEDNEDAVIEIIKNAPVHGGIAYDGVVRAE